MSSIQINIGDHVSPHAGWVAVPNTHRGTVGWARTRAKAVAKGMPSADRYFKTLPNGRTLTALLNDSSIWINFDPAGTEFGANSVAHPNEIAIGTRSFRIGRWTVLATIIHELAHVNGAPGGTDRRAEEALLHCGLGKLSERASGTDDPHTPFDPNIGG
jgi:hypothetical protein